MNLKELARKKGTNLKKVAESCGIPPTTLYAISRGDTNFDNVGIGTMIKVAGALGMTAEELYKGDYEDVGFSQLTDFARRFATDNEPDVVELVRLYESMDEPHQDLLMQTALAFSNLDQEAINNKEDDK